MSETDGGAPSAKESIAEPPVPGTALHILPADGGGVTVRTLVAGEPLPLVALPAGHRLIAVIEETFAHLRAEIAAALASPGEPANDQVQAIAARAPVAIRTGSATWERPPVLRPGQQPTPAQAAVTPAVPIGADGTVKPVPPGPAHLR